MTHRSGPLVGRRVLVTRTRERAEGLVDRLHDAGASVVVVPLITITPIAGPDAIALAAAEVSAAHAPRWVAFTSATAVRLVLGATGTSALTAMRIAAVGPSTATALQAEGATPDLVAAEHDAGGLATAMLERGMAGATVWAPVAEAARDEFAQRLRNGGAAVRVQHIYRSVMPLHAPEDLRAALAVGVDAITLTSGSTARHLVEALGSSRVPERVAIVCIGEQTAADARVAGLTVAAIAPEASAEGLVRALTGCLAPQPLR